MCVLGVVASVALTLADDDFSTPVLTALKSGSASDDKALVYTAAQSNALHVPQQVFKSMYQDNAALWGDCSLNDVRLPDGCRS